MFGMGLTSALSLAIAARIFHVKENPRLAAIKAALPALIAVGEVSPDARGQLKRF